MMSVPKKRAVNAHTSTNLESQRKRENAAKFVAAYRALSVTEKIALVANRPGASRREMARLIAQLPEQKVA